MFFLCHTHTHTDRVLRFPPLPSVALDLAGLGKTRKHMTLAAMLTDLDQSEERTTVFAPIDIAVESAEAHGLRSYSEGQVRVDD